MAKWITTTTISLRVSMGDFLGYSTTSLNGTVATLTHGGTNDMGWYRSKTFRRCSIGNSWDWLDIGSPTYYPWATITSPYTAVSANYDGATILSKAISHTNYTFSISQGVTYSSTETWTHEGWYSGTKGTGTWYGPKNYTIPSTLADVATFWGYSSGIKKCLAPGSMVKMADGTTKAVETLQPGDEIATMNISGFPSAESIQSSTDLYQWNDTTLYTEPSSTTVIDVQPVQSTRIINFNNGLIKTTPSHIFIVEKELADGSIAWTCRGAFNLVVGDKLLDENGNDVEITSVVYEDAVDGQAHTAYQVDLVDNGTIISDGIVTHNRHNV